jgi:hypothetical protein
MGTFLRKIISVFISGTISGASSYVMDVFYPILTPFLGIATFPIILLITIVLSEEERDFAGALFSIDGFLAASAYVIGCYIVNPAAAIWSIIWILFYIALFYIKDKYL